MEKWEVYIWLQAKLGLDARQTHIGQFSEYMCEQVISPVSYTHLDVYKRQSLCWQALNRRRSLPVLKMTA